MKKIDSAKILFQKNSNLFMCPVCGNRMNINHSSSLTCTENHCFDLSKKGYINLLLNSPKIEYGKDMLQSRNIICNNGFFAPMLDTVSSLIEKNTNSSTDIFNILDAGCGEGSHLYNILINLKDNSKYNFQGAGIDISKEGINIASGKYSDILWCVADLSKLPFRNEKFDIILSILSPSNYSEFNRVLKKNGVLIKVAPGSNYLKELRTLLYDKTDKENYSNHKVINHFANNFNLLNKQDIQYNIALDEENIEHLIKMTPLSWSADKSTIEQAINLGLKNITVDFSIMIGKSA